jgi:hypothetical protein
MKFNSFDEGECVLTAQKHCACIEFVLNEKERHGFAISQLLHYHLEANPSQDFKAPPERMIVAFATADVVLLGWRLGRLANKLRDGELLAARTLPARYANIDPAKTSVTSITVVPVKKD